MCIRTGQSKIIIFTVLSIVLIGCSESIGAADQIESSGILNFSISQLSQCVDSGGANRIISDSTVSECGEYSDDTERDILLKDILDPNMLDDREGAIREMIIMDRRESESFDLIPDSLRLLENDLCSNPDDGNVEGSDLVQSCHMCGEILCCCPAL